MKISTSIIQLLFALLITSTSAFTVRATAKPCQLKAFQINYSKSQAILTTDIPVPKCKPILYSKPMPLSAELTINSRSTKFSRTQLFSSSTSNDQYQENEKDNISKFKSLTAIRATIRATTGFSLTALRTTLRGLTGVSVTGTMKSILSVFPAWFRYFLQPFLILYYTPLMILRCWVGPTKTSRIEAKAAHEKVIEGWKKAIEVAEAAQDGGYWPVRVNSEGVIEAALPPDPSSIVEQSFDISDAIVNSVEIALKTKENDEA